MQKNIDMSGQSQKCKYVSIHRILLSVLAAVLLLSSLSACDRNSYFSDTQDISPSTSSESSSSMDSGTEQSDESSSETSESSTSSSTESQSETSFLLRECDEQDGVELKGAGPGVLNYVVLCEGEDWWTPEESWSDEGIIFSGYGYPAGNENNTATKGQAFYSNWQSLESSEGSIRTTLTRLLNKYGANEGTENEKKLYLTIHAGVGGSESPAYLYSTYGIPLLTDYLDGTASDSIADFSVLTESQKKTWKEYYTTYEYAYPFWNTQFLNYRKNFHKTLYQFLQAHDHGDLVMRMNLNGEFGFVWQYLLYGVMSKSEIDAAIEGLFDSALESGIPAKYWLANLNVGGRAYKNVARLAAKYETGIGNHGAPSFLPYSFAQHLEDYLQYDEDLLAYRMVDEKPFAFVHTDAEFLDQLIEDDEGNKTVNEYGQYRMFRFLVLATMSMGVDSYLVSSSTIPSKGEWEDTYGRGNQRQLNFEWDNIKDLGAWDFLQWMNKIVGKSAMTSKEAYCSLSQSGVPIPEIGEENYDGKTFSELVAEYKSDDTWSYDKTWPAHLRAPLLTYFGFHCDLDRTVDGGQPYAVLRLDEERIGQVEPPLNGRAFGDGSDDEVSVYEGKTTESPNDYQDSDYSKANHSLYFRLNDDFKGNRGSDDGLKSTFVIKIIFENYKESEGNFRLEYDSKNGWVEGPEVTVTKDDKGIMTATYQIDDARFYQKGPGNTDFAIRSVSGENMAFLMVRVLKI